MRKEDFFDASLMQKKALRKGDRVRFLNSVGGGIVTALRGKEQVLVEDENGFEVPVLVTECVVIGELQKDGLKPQKDVSAFKKAIVASQKDASASKKAIFAPQKEVSTPHEAKVTKPVDEPFVETPQGERLNLSLAFLPVEPHAFMQSPFEVYFINESNYYLYINYMYCKNNSWTSRFHGLIEPDTKIFMEEFEKSALNELEHICIQLIAFKEEKTFSLKNALSVEIRLDTVKFYKIHCFTKNGFFDEDALIVPLVLHDVPERQMLVSATDIQAALFIREKEDRGTSQPVPRKMKHADNRIEVDLHINQLIDNTSGMSNTDMLQCQLAKFHEVMKTSAGKKGQKIVFIHGKGEGVLRAAMEKELQTTYKRQCRFQDASFREYGFGATLVTIF